MISIIEINQKVERKRETMTPKFYIENLLGDKKKPWA